MVTVTETVTATVTATTVTVTITITGPYIYFFNSRAFPQSRETLRDDFPRAFGSCETSI